METFDIVIIGTGIIGLATACALGNTSLKIAVVDNKKITVDLLEQPGIRASAINISSQHYFSRIGIWDALLDSNRVLTFNEISVREKSGFAALDAHSKDSHYANLGHIIENDLITKVLYEKALSCSNISFFYHRVNYLSSQPDKMVIQLTDHSRLTAKLVVAADGANSWVRESVGMKLWQYHYRHHAIMATVTSEKSHNSCARQLFYSDGIIAFLPLWQPNLSCLVWSAKSKEAADLRCIEPAIFSKRLTEMTSGWLGRCQLASRRDYFPLIARYAPEFIQHRLILIGDACHTIHPLAGQGANLGLRDSAQLTDTAKRLHKMELDIGLKPNWREYQFARHKDVLMMLAGMQSIETLFDGQFVLKKWFRAIGMNMINHMPIIKKRLLKYALGL